MKKTSTGLLLFLALLLTATGLRAQQSPLPRSASDFVQFQQELHTWLADPAHRNQKGWKSLARWAEFEAQRMNPDQSAGDPREMATTLADIAATKSSTAKTAGNGWLPAGPNNYAISQSDWIPGMGRINCIAFHPTNGDIFWVGVAQGGVWRTQDGGQNWTPLTDDLPMLRVSDIAVNPSNPNEIYLSMGDYAYFGAGLNLDNRKRHTHYGLGVYKTTDGGITWAPTGLSMQQMDFDFSLTRRVFIHPTNTNSLVAAGTHGIWTSSNAGASWTHVNDSLIWDIERDPNNPNVLYASKGYRSSLDMGYAGIMKSTNFGASWTMLPTNIPVRNAVQRIEVAVSPSNSNIVYALCAGMDAGFYALLRSTDAGASWIQQSNSPNILDWYDGFNTGGQGWYDLTLLIHPTNPDIIYTGGINLWASTDAGLTWDAVSYWLASYGPSVHADQHQLAYNPVSGKYYICNDGGLYGTNQIVRGSWFDANTIPGYQWPTQWTQLSGGMQITSFYRVGTSANNADYLIAGAQDNSTYYYDKTNWFNIFGGDGMECFIDPNDPAMIYGSSQYGALSSSFDGGITSNWAGGNINETGEWTTPWMLDPLHNDTLYAAFGNVFRSSDGGFNWDQLSNLPVNNFYGHANISCALDVSQTSPKSIYVAKRPNYFASENGSFWVSSDGGSTWNDRTLGLNDSLYITDIAAHPTAAGTVALTMGGFLAGEKVFLSTNYGQTWTSITGNLPNLPANTLVYGPDAYHTLFVGMDVGVWYINDTLSTWQLYANDLPNVIVSDLEVHAATNRLYAATFGRGIWQVDLPSVPLAIGDPSFGAARMDLYPNPSNGFFRVQLEGVPAGKAAVQVINTLGAKVMQQDIQLSDKVGSFDLALDLAPGVYYLDLRTAGRHLSRKFVVQ